LDWSNYDFNLLQFFLDDLNVAPNFVTELFAVVGLHSEESIVSTDALRSGQLNFPSVVRARHNNILNF